MYYILRLTFIIVSQCSLIRTGHYLVMFLSHVATAVCVETKTALELVSTWVITIGGLSRDGAVSQLTTTVDQTQVSEIADRASGFRSSIGGNEEVPCEG